MKEITWRTKIGFRYTIISILLFALVLLGTTFYSSSDMFLLFYRISAGICGVLFLVGYISSFLSIISKQEKRSIGLIILFAFASLLILWVVMVMALGSTGFYD
ncbi:hypothetical protein PGRAN_14118 [Listeria grandensis FSL F6-0971]|uniref:Uncharacterized protein n=1 Tax=Listeria grandensis FSL F6-0971 TaxID=1265819 RepID=W7B742_9LIST|nr:hypothetical protein [Listeria grandensis]EUJ21737.1 hypothetical protein PGRAN_14118 [Listeria grandensis FSL F6-0971]